MNFPRLLALLATVARNDSLDFPAKAKAVTDALNVLSNAECRELAFSIHVIPESYGHDSSEEKLYAKASDSLVAAVFRHFGLTTRVLQERGDAADVVGQSANHGYSFVADSKVFRLSRTAKNQKDFKVGSMHQWKGESDYAAVICPLYQYPSRSSAIYAQSLNYKVALLSFEHLIFLQNHNFQEDRSRSLAPLFDYPSRVSEQVLHAERKKAAPLMKALDETICTLANSTLSEFERFKAEFKAHLSIRASQESDFWQSERQRYERMSRDEAITALISLAKIDSKIATIDAFIRQDAYEDDVVVTEE